LKQLFSSVSEDDSDLSVVNKMAVSELLNKGQSMDVILDCLKVGFAKLWEHPFISMCKNYRLLSKGEFCLIHCAFETSF